MAPRAYLRGYDAAGGKQTAKNAPNIEKTRRPADEVYDNPVDHLSGQRRTGEETLDLVRRTFEAIQAAKEWAQAKADKANQRAQQAVDELTIAEQRIKSLEDEVRRAQIRARESEQWLERVHEGIRRNLMDRE